MFVHHEHRPYKSVAHLLQHGDLLEGEGQLLARARHALDGQARDRVEAVDKGLASHLLFGKGGGHYQCLKKAVKNKIACCS